MPAAASRVRVHGAEVSTDGESVGMYAEAIALIVAIAALLAAVWVASTPSEGADLARPTGDAAPGYVLTPDGYVVQPRLEGPDEVAVVVPDGSPASFAEPFATSLPSTAAVVGASGSAPAP